MRLEPLSPSEVFLTRLRRRRERHGISLEEVSAATRVKAELLERFERGDLTGWPTGLYARAWVRGYARAIGADEDDAVEDFCRLAPPTFADRARTVARLVMDIRHPADLFAWLRQSWVVLRPGAGGDLPTRH